MPIKVEKGFEKSPPCSQPKVCKIEGCGAASKTLGLCWKHYEEENGKEKPNCKAEEGCGRKSFALGLCLMHYKRLKKHGTTKSQEQTILERFEKCFIKGNENQCWEWQRAKIGVGYGQFEIQGRCFRAHRLSYELYVAKIERSDLCVLHKCDNPGCVNPNHLFLGTADDNYRDMVAKGRAGYQKKSQKD